MSQTPWKSRENKKNTTVQKRCITLFTFIFFLLWPFFFWTQNLDMKPHNWQNGPICGCIYTQNILQQERNSVAVGATTNHELIWKDYSGKYRRCSVTKVGEEMSGLMACGLPIRVGVGGIPEQWGWVSRHKGGPWAAWKQLDVRDRTSSAALTAMDPARHQKPRKRARVTQMPTTVIF